MAKDSAIDVVELTRYYRDFLAVDQISFAIEEGHIFGLLGPNGAGKSTTVKMLTTLLPPSSGSARILGFDVIKDSAKVRASVGYVPQLLSADGDLSAYENLQLSARLYGMHGKLLRQRIEEVLSFMGLLDVKDQLVSSYSGGMIRRLEIAQALTHRPPVLFLDEPTVGLDPGARKTVWKHLHEWRREYNTTILMTTHDMEEADRACDIVAFMHHGKIVAMDTPQRLKESLGPNMTLDDAFIHYTGSTITESGDLAMPDRCDERSLGANKISRTILQTLAVVEADLYKLRHDPYEVLMRMIQPAMWLLLFGQAMAHVRGFSNLGTTPYLDFIAPGVLAQSVLFVAIFYGVALIWERDAGILHKIMVTPAPRATLVVGRALGAGVRSLFQLALIYTMSLSLGIDLRFSLWAFLGVVAMVMLVASIFSTLSLIVATIVKKRERFMGIGQLLTMPFFFASNSLYPIDSMPDWIRHLSHVNPLTYQVDALRTLMISGQVSQFGLSFDYGVNFALFVILVFIATKRYPKILY